MPLLISLGQKHKQRNRPNAEYEAEGGPEVFGIAVIVGEQAAHDTVKEMNN
jgi:hypothetical protein